MSTTIRKLAKLSVSLAALGLAANASAAVNGRLLERARGGEDAERSQQHAPRQAAPQQQSAPAPRAAPMAREQGRSGGREQIRDSYRGREARGPITVPSVPQVANNNGRGRSSGNSSAFRGDRNPGVVGETIQRNFRSGDGGRGDYRGDDRRHDWRDNRSGRHYNNYDNHRSRVVQRLPHGYRNHHWNGRPYYSHGGRWYRPWGSSFISIGVPYGMFVSTLPGYYNSFWYGSSRYYYSDDTYYLYEPTRRGYVVARSPYDDGRDDQYADEPMDEDLYIYPARGQSEQQQADDRYECHRWATGETGYDPIDADYDSDRRADYLRAMTACLTGRGYTVR